MSSGPTPRQAPTRVLVVCREPVVALGLALLAVEHPDLALVTDDVLDVTSAVAGYDVVLYDVLGLYRHRGADLRAVLARGDVRVIALTRDLRPDLGTQALDLGVHGCVSLHAPTEELFEAVRELAAAPAGPVEAGGDPTARLTSRERDVVVLIAAGRSNAQIAAELGISVVSVKSYVRTAYRSMGVSDRPGAVAWALSHLLG